MSSGFQFRLRRRRLSRGQEALSRVTHEVMGTVVAVDKAALGVPIQVRTGLRVGDLALHIVVGPCAPLARAGAVRAVRLLALVVRPAAPRTRPDLSRTGAAAHSGP